METHLNSNYLRALNDGIRIHILIHSKLVVESVQSTVSFIVILASQRENEMISSEKNNFPFSNLNYLLDEYCISSSLQPFQCLILSSLPTIAFPSNIDADMKIYPYNRRSKKHRFGLRF